MGGIFGFQELRRPDAERRWLAQRLFACREDDMPDRAPAPAASGAKGDAESAGEGDDAHEAATFPVSVATDARAGDAGDEAGLLHQPPTTVAFESQKEEEVEIKAYAPA